jgi:hypothetical protein
MQEVRAEESSNDEENPKRVKKELAWKDEVAWRDAGLGN